MAKKSIPELMEAYRKGKMPEAVLFSLLSEYIPEWSIDEILRILDEALRPKFLMTLTAISKPGWQSLDGWRPPAGAITAMREYFRKLGKSSAGWNREA